LAFVTGVVLTLEGAIEVYLETGDALLFVDGLVHGGGSRTNPGEHRVVI
jgi:ectoine hydroxylase-related dioxygenase (phytanoyl-CoA dioxygenase family)